MPLIGRLPTSGEALTVLLPSMCGQAGEVAFLVATQKCVTGALPCLGFLFAKKLLWQEEDSRWKLGKKRKRRKKMPGSCLLQVQPRAVVKGQPPSVPSWGSTPFQYSGLVLEADTF